jgi:glucose-1-phosphate thymidylyltransferase
VKAVIPAAGVGTRLRPHTLTKPKALLPVAGRPIIAHIMDDLFAAGVDAFVIILGYGGQKVRDWLASERPQYEVTCVEQARRLGLGHALWTARKAIGEDPFLCILGDTILKADIPSMMAADRSIIAVRAVEDPRRFGVVEMDGERVSRLVEKPDDPRSNLAIVGAYYFQECAALWRALDRVVREDIRTKGEYQLTDALQMMVDGGLSFGIESVREWYDCGKPETWLATNRALLAEQEIGSQGPGVGPSCWIAEHVELRDAKIGPYVSIGVGTRIENCELSDCIIGESVRLRDCQLHGSLVGDHSRLVGVVGQVDVGDFCTMRLGDRD